MEMVLDVYKHPFDSRYPVVCMDESPKQLIAETKANRKDMTMSISVAVCATYLWLVSL
jgi:hypothetical protein